MGLRDVLAIVRLVEELEKVETVESKTVQTKEGRQHPVSELYARENFTVTGSVTLYETRGPLMLREASIVTDSDSYEFRLVYDNRVLSGDFGYWQAMSRYTSTVDAFRSVEGLYVLRLQDIPFRDFLRMEMIASKVRVKALLVKVVPLEHG